jgi:hypothetical protein
MINTVEELHQALDDLQELARAGDIGQGTELWVDDEEVMCVDLGVPGENGWSVRHGSTRTNRNVITLNPDSDDEETVVYKWGDNWQETEARCFIDPALARRAVVQFFEHRTLSDEVNWVPSGVTF